MSTRANIVLKQNIDAYKEAHPDYTEDGAEIWLYHHSDGYLSYLGKYLVDFMRNYYVPGQCRPYIEDVATALVKGVTKDQWAGRNEQEWLDDDSFEVTTGQHGDIEYLYTIEEIWDKDDRMTAVQLYAKHLSSGIKELLMEATREDDGWHTFECTLWQDMDDMIDDYYRKDDEEE